MAVVAVCVKFAAAAIHIKAFVAAVSPLQAAAKALQRLHNPEVVAPMLRVVTSAEEDGEVKAAVATALGQYREDNVFQGLLVALDDRRLSVNLNAAESLSLLTGQAWGMDRVAWKRWYDGLETPSLAFEAHKEYMYPTYSRDKVWFEYIAFWIQESQEQPSQPAGLRPKSQRQTWTDEPEAEEASGS